MEKEITVFKCDHIGVAGTTDVHVKLRKTQGGNDIYEARCGIALMGSTQMDEWGFKACNYDPFHPEFLDNYCIGRGATQEEAIERLKEDMKDTANSI